MYPFSRHTRCSTSCFFHATICHGHPSTSVHSDLLHSFYQAQSWNTEFQYREITQEPLGQSLLLNRWAPQRSWTPLTPGKQPEPPHHGATPAGVTTITPASWLSKKAKQKGKASHVVARSKKGDKSLLQ